MEPKQTACSWCEAETGTHTEGSHGICDQHLAEQLAELARKRLEAAQERFAAD